MFDTFEIVSGRCPNESISILVGPNGSGKSSLLRRVAEDYRNHRNIAIVCNTPHDRFTGLARTHRVAIGKAKGSPRNIVKNAVVRSLMGSGEDLYRINATLEYCGYRPRFGFSIEPGIFFRDSIRDARIRSQERMAGETDQGSEDLFSEQPFSVETDTDLEQVEAFLRRHDPSEKVWIDASEQVLYFSLAREFATVLKLESRLRRWNILRSIRVFLQQAHNPVDIEIHHASSGQLALISSLLFLIINADSESIVIIDEPENSLHPKWQREYVEKIMAALNYRNPTLVIATHAPLIVTGALASNPHIVSVFEVQDGSPRQLQIKYTENTPISIEELLWRAFDVVTPANHFVSEEIVDEISRLEKGQVTKRHLLEMIGKMEAGSFDDRQREFFDAVRVLIEKVDANRNAGG